MKAFCGSPPPVDQPGLVALLKSKAVVGCDGGDEGGDGGRCGGQGGEGGDEGGGGDGGGSEGEGGGGDGELSSDGGGCVDGEGAEGGEGGGMPTTAKSTGSHCGGQAPPRVEERDSERGRPTACELPTSNTCTIIVGAG